MIDKATVDKILNRADIVEVVGDYVHLMRRGRNYMGLCPFHNERTPSFSVSPQRNFCYCFSCHQGGSPVSFIMQKEGLSYPDALKFLANKYGIPVEERELTDEQRAALTEREAMLVANEWAMRHMESTLHDTEEGRNVGLEYFRQRGVTDEAVKAFHLGYSLDNGHDLVDAAKKEGHNLGVMETLGLIGTHNGRQYDKYHGRVIYPIFNTSGKVFGFGGRDLKGKSPAKYINSPESAVYKKSNELYGLYQARQEIGRQGSCFLVEGYMDVIGMWQSGLKNVVASSGTALTDAQVALIHRFTDKVTVIYDGDSAGIHAALRAINMLLANKMEVHLLLLPDNHDPDSFARTRTAEEFRQYVADHQKDFVGYQTEVLMRDVTDSAAKTRAINTITESIAYIPDPIARIVYIQSAAQRLNIPEEAVAQSVNLKADSVNENLRRQREAEKLKRDFPTGQQQPQGETPTQTTQSPQPLPKTEEEKRYPLRKYEKEIVRYVVRYGFLPYISLVEEDEKVLNVAEYVDFNLQEQPFTYPVYKKVVDKVLAMRAEYDEAYNGHYNSVVAPAVNKYMADRRQELAEKELSMEALTEAENKLEEEAEELCRKEMEQFTIDFSQRRLASDDDDEVRTCSIELIAEPYVLSKYHKKQPGVVPESEKLDELLPRAILELRDGAIKLKIDATLEKLTVAQQQGDAAALAELMTQYQQLLTQRRETAKEIGERIISPR